MNTSGVTVRELLQLPILKDAKVISGNEGMGRIVRFIDIMEVPDIEGWLREGELLLTTAYSIRHDPTLLPKLVENLAEANAAALAIKPERFIHDMPQEMIEASNRYHLPIIQIPTGIPYIDITHSVMEQILDKQATLLRRSDEIFKALTNLVLNNSGIQVVADNVAALVHSPIWVVDRAGDPIVYSPASAMCPERMPSRFWDLNVDKQFVGKLFIEKEKLDELELVCIEHARLVFSLELMRIKTAVDTERKLRGNFVEDLLTGLPLARQEVENRGRQLGLMPDWIWEIAIIELENLVLEEEDPHFTQLKEKIYQVCRLWNVKSHFHMQGDRVVLLLPALPNKRSSAESWSQLLTPILQEWSRARTGFGDPYFLWDIQKSYFEAKRALSIGSRLDRHQKVFSFEELELFQLLLEASDHVSLDSYTDKKIGRLREYDKENGTDLLLTLYYYLESGGSLMETANKLYIHRNSVKYRMDRVREIIGTNLDKPSERFMFYLCLAQYLIKRSV